MKIWQLHEALKSVFITLHKTVETVSMFENTSFTKLGMLIMTCLTVEVKCCIGSITFIILGVELIEVALNTLIVCVCVCVCYIYI